jgi:hypothetical protein
MNGGGGGPGGPLDALAVGGVAIDGVGLSLSHVPLGRGAIGSALQLVIDAMSAASAIDRPRFRDCTGARCYTGAHARA